MNPHKPADQVLAEIREIVHPALLNQDVYARIEVELLTSACWSIARMQDQIKRMRNQKGTMTARARRLEARVAARDADIVKLRADYEGILKFMKWGEKA